MHEATAGPRRSRLLRERETGTLLRRRDALCRARRFIQQSSSRVEWRRDREERGCKKGRRERNSRLCCCCFYPSFPPPSADVVRALAAGLRERESTASTCWCLFDVIRRGFIRDALACPLMFSTPSAFLSSTLEFIQTLIRFSLSLPPSVPNRPRKPRFTHALTLATKVSHRLFSHKIIKDQYNSSIAKLFKTN